jgi:hypothetical protein
MDRQLTLLSYGKNLLVKWAKNGISQTIIYTKELIRRHILRWRTDNTMVRWKMTKRQTIVNILKYYTEN